MNEQFRLFNKEDIPKLKDIEKANKGKYTGFFYIIEWDNLVKIGSTRNPYQRIMDLKRSAENYGNSKIGRFAISVPHTNYANNETLLHRYFKSARKTGSELFDLDIEYVLNNIPNSIKYLDETEEKERQAEAFLNKMKSFVTGGREMLNEVQVFDNSSEFSNIRILNIDDEPWFVGKDVCDAFGDTNYRRSISNIDDSDKSMSKIDTAGGKQNMVIINESGLYSLLFQMQPQKGVSQSEPPLQVESRVKKLRRFKKWVTGTVLPQIRKTGSYGKPMSTAEQIQLLAKGTTELNERVGEIEEKVTSLEYDMPLYGCEIDEVQKHIKRKGIEILGGKDSAAYKDASIRSSLYSDMYKQLKREYGCVATYKSIKRKYIADVHDFIDCYEPPRCLEEQITKGV